MDNIGGNYKGGPNFGKKEAENKPKIPKNKFQEYLNPLRKDDDTLTISQNKPGKSQQPLPSNSIKSAQMLLNDTSVSHKGFHRDMFAQLHCPHKIVETPASDTGTLQEHIGFIKDLAGDDRKFNPYSKEIETITTLPKMENVTSFKREVLKKLNEGKYVYLPVDCRKEKGEGKQSLFIKLFKDGDNVKFYIINRGEGSENHPNVSGTVGKFKRDVRSCCFQIKYDDLVDGYVYGSTNQFLNKVFDAILNGDQPVSSIYVLCALDSDKKSSNEKLGDFGASAQITGGGQQASLHGAFLDIFSSKKKKDELLFLLKQKSLVEGFRSQQKNLENDPELCLLFREAVQQHLIRIEKHKSSFNNDFDLSTAICFEIVKKLDEIESSPKKEIHKSGKTDTNIKISSKKSLGKIDSVKNDDLEKEMQSLTVPPEPIRWEPKQDATSCVKQLKEVSKKIIERLKNDRDPMGLFNQISDLIMQIPVSDDLIWKNISSQDANDCLAILDLMMRSALKCLFKVEEFWKNAPSSKEQRFPLDKERLQLIALLAFDLGIFMAGKTEELQSVRGYDVDVQERKFKKNPKYLHSTYFDAICKTLERIYKRNPGKYKNLNNVILSEHVIDNGDFAFIRALVSRQDKEAIDKVVDYNRYIDKKGAFFFIAVCQLTGYQPDEKVKVPSVKTDIKPIPGLQSLMNLSYFAREIKRSRLSETVHYENRNALLVPEGFSDLPFMEISRIAAHLEAPNTITNKNNFWSYAGMVQLMNSTWIDREFSYESHSAGEVESLVSSHWETSPLSKIQDLDQRLLQELVLMRIHPETAPMQALSWVQEQREAIIHPKIRKMVSKLLFGFNTFRLKVKNDPKLTKESIDLFIKNVVGLYKNSKDIDTYLWALDVAEALMNYQELYDKDYKKVSLDKEYSELLNRPYDQVLQTKIASHYLARFIDKPLGKEDGVDFARAYFIYHYLPIKTPSSIDFGAKQAVLNHQTKLWQFIKENPENFGAEIAKLFPHIKIDQQSVWKFDEKEGLVCGPYKFSLRGKITNNGKEMVPLAEYLKSEQLYVEYFKDRVAFTFYPQEGYFINPEGDCRLVIHKQKQKSPIEAIERKIKIDGEEKWFRYQSRKEIVLLAKQFPQIPCYMLEQPYRIFIEVGVKSPSILITTKEDKPVSILISEGEKGLLSVEDNINPENQVLSENVVGKTTHFASLNSLSGAEGWKKYFGQVEDLRYITFHFDEKNNVIGIVLDRLGLDFTVKKGQFRCTQFVDFYLDLEPQEAPFKTVKNFLVIKNKKGQTKIIVPFHPFKSLQPSERKNWAMKMSIPLDMNKVDQGTPYFVYECTFMGDFKATSPAGALYMALLYRTEKQYEKALRMLKNSDSPLGIQEVDLVIENLLAFLPDLSPEGVAFHLHFLARNIEHEKKIVNHRHVMESKSQIKTRLELIKVLVEKYCMAFSHVVEDVYEIPKELRLSKKEMKIFADLGHSLNINDLRKLDGQEKVLTKDYNYLTKEATIDSKGNLSVSLLGSVLPLEECLLQEGLLNDVKVFEENYKVQAGQVSQTIKDIESGYTQAMEGIDKDAENKWKKVYKTETAGMKKVLSQLERYSDFFDHYMKLQKEIEKLIEDLMKSEKGSLRSNQIKRQIENKTQEMEKNALERKEIKNQIGLINKKTPIKFDVNDLDDHGKFRAVLNMYTATLKYLKNTAQLLSVAHGLKYFAENRAKEMKLKTGKQSAVYNINVLPKKEDSDDYLYNHFYKICVDLRGPNRDLAMTHLFGISKLGVEESKSLIHLLLYSLTLEGSPLPQIQTSQLIEWLLYIALDDLKRKINTKQKIFLPIFLLPQFQLPYDKNEYNFLIVQNKAKRDLEKEEVQVELLEDFFPSSIKEQDKHPEDVEKLKGLLKDDNVDQEMLSRLNNLEKDPQKLIEEIDREIEKTEMIEKFHFASGDKVIFSNAIKKLNSSISFLENENINPLALVNQKKVLEKDLESAEEEIKVIFSEVKSYFKVKSKSYEVDKQYLLLKKRLVKDKLEIENFKAASWGEKLKCNTKDSEVETYYKGELSREPMKYAYAKPSVIHAFVWKNLEKIYNDLQSSSSWKKEGVVKDLIELAGRSGLDSQKTPEAILIQLLLFSTTYDKLTFSSREGLLELLINRASDKRMEGCALLYTFSIPTSMEERRQELKRIEEILRDPQSESVLLKSLDTHVEDKYKALKDYQDKFEEDNEIQNEIDEQLYENYGIKSVEEFKLIPLNDPKRKSIDVLIGEKKLLDLEGSEKRLLNILSPQEKKDFFGIGRQDKQPSTYLFNREKALEEYTIAIEHVQLRKQAVRLRHHLNVKAPFDSKAPLKSEKIKLSSEDLSSIETFKTEDGKSFSSLANIYGDFFTPCTKISEANDLKEWEGLGEQDFFNEEEINKNDPIAKEKMKSLNSAQQKLVKLTQTTYSLHGEPNFINRERVDNILQQAQKLRDEAVNIANDIQDKDLVLFKKSKQQRPLTLRDLMAAYLKQDVSHLLDVNPTLTQEKIKQIFVCLMEADLHTCQAKQFEEIEEVLNKDLPEDELVNQIASIVDRRIDINVLLRYPQLSLYAAATGLWPREDQIEAIDWALQELKQGRDPSARLLQMGAGAGKTKVFTVFVSMIASARGYGVTVFNISSLYDFGKSDLPVALRDAFMMNVELVEWDVGRDDVDQRKLVDLYQKLLQWKDEGKVILLKPETWHLINIARKKGKLTQNEGLTLAAQSVLSYFQGNLSIFDEAHLIFNPLTEVNQSIGEPKEFPPHLTQLMIENYDHLVEMKDLGIEQDRQALAKTEDIAEAKKVLIDKFLEEYVPENKEEVAKWLWTPGQEAIKPTWLNLMVKENKDLAECIEMQRRFVHSTLSFVLSKRGDNDYGEYPSTEKGFDGKLYAHPRHDRALTTASYADEGITVALTIQMTHQKSLSKEALKQLIIYLIRNHRLEKEEGVIGMTESEKWLKDLLGNKEIPDFDLVSLDFFDQYDDLLKDSKVVKNWYLTHVVLSQIEIYERKIVSTPAELMYGSDFNILLTATPGDLSVYPKFLNGPEKVGRLTECSILDVESEAIVVGLMLAKRNSEIKDVDDYDDVEHFFGKVAGKEELKNIKFIIDKAGGFRKLKDGDKVLNVLHKLVGETTSYGVVVKQTPKGRKAHFITYGQGGEEIPLEGSNLENEMKKSGRDAEKLKSAVFFYSILESGAGTDWKLPDECIGIFTVGENMKLSDAIQALKRDRKLAMHTHSFKWVIQKALKEKIAKNLGIEADQITPYHLVCWMIKNEALEESNKVNMRFEQGVDQMLNKKILRRGTRMQEKSLEVFTDKSPLAWSTKKKEEKVSSKILLWQEVVKKIALTHPEEMSKLVNHMSQILKRDKGSVDQEIVIETYIRNIDVEDYKKMVDPKRKIIKEGVDDDVAQFKIFAMRILGVDLANSIEELVDETDKKISIKDLGVEHANLDQEHIKIKQIEGEEETEVEVEHVKNDVSDVNTLEPRSISYYPSEEGLGNHAKASATIDQLLSWPSGVEGPEIYGSEKFFKMYNNRQDMIRPVAAILVEIDQRSGEKKYHLLSQEGLKFYSDQVKREKIEGKNFLIVSPTGSLLAAKNGDDTFKQLHREPLFRQMLSKVALFEGKILPGKYTKQLFQNWVDHSSDSEIGQFIEKISKPMDKGLFAIRGVKFEKNQFKLLLKEMFKEKKLKENASKSLWENKTENTVIVEETLEIRGSAESGENITGFLLKNGIGEIKEENKELDIELDKDVANMASQIQSEFLQFAERTLVSLKSVARQHRGSQVVSLWNIDPYIEYIDNDNKLDKNKKEEKTKMITDMQKFFMKNVAQAMIDLKKGFDLQGVKNSTDRVIQIAMEKLGPGVEKGALANLLESAIKNEKTKNPYRKWMKEAEEQFFDHLWLQVPMNLDSEEILRKKFKELLSKKLGL